MILCGGDQLLFGLYSVAIICLLIGGCFWGRGTDSGDKNDFYGGLVVFLIGGGFAIMAILVNIIKVIKKRAKSKKILVQSKSFDINMFQKNFQNPQEDQVAVPKTIDCPLPFQKSFSNEYYPEPPVQFSNFPLVTANEPVFHANGNKQPPYKHNNREPAFYDNPSFDSDIRPHRPVALPNQYAQVPRPNAAKNYSLSLYYAHMAGKI